MSVAPTIGRRSHGRVSQLLFKAFLLFSLLVGFVTLGVLLVDVLKDGLPALSWSLFTDPPSSDPEIAGARPAIIATILMMLLLIVMAIPVGVATALYLEEYANKERWYNRFLEVNIQNLAAVPSIVYGILGLAFLVRGLGRGRGVRAVPSSIRDGGLALGATKWQVIWRQILPAAIPGIATGSILGVSRAIGETAPLLLIGAVTYISFDPTILGPFTALPIQIYQWVRLPQAEFRELAAAAIIVLLVLLLTLNAFAIWIRNRYQKRW
jgi:phosphate transport system permease protein